MKDLSYLTRYYDEKIARIRALRAPLNFVFITDQHNRLTQHALKDQGIEDPARYELAVDAIRSIQYILDRCPEISFVVSGGDIGNDYARDPGEVRASLQEVMDALYSLSVPVHCVVGNHDDALGNAIDRGDDTVPFAILPQEMHALCMKYNPTPENYYYLDEPAGYRLIFLNTSDKPYYRMENGQYPFGWRLEISDRQAEWLETQALQTERKIILISHSPLHNAGIFGTEGIGPNVPRSAIKPYDDTLNAPRVYYDVKRCKQVIAMLCGHVHYDNLIYDDDIVTVTTLSSFAQEWAPSSPRRVMGDITETAFDVFSFTENMLFITRFGAGCDRQAFLLR